MKKANTTDRAQGKRKGYTRKIAKAIPGKSTDPLMIYRFITADRAGRA